MTFEVYANVDWEGSATDRRSTSNCCTFLGGNLVSWRSNKKLVVAKSSVEAEFHALVHELCEPLRIRIILSDLRIS